MHLFLILPKKKKEYSGFIFVIFFCLKRFYILFMVIPKNIDSDLMLSVPKDTTQVNSSALQVCVFLFFLIILPFVIFFLLLHVRV